MINLKSEITWEASTVSLDRLVECLRRNAVQFREVMIEHDALAADDVDGRRFGSFGHGGMMPRPWRNDRPDLAQETAAIRCRVNGVSRAAVRGLSGRRFPDSVSVA